MLWYKSWLDTRWRFVIGLGVLMLSVIGSVVAYPQLAKLLPAASAIDTGGELGRRIKENLDLSSSYRGYIWTQLFGQNFLQMGTLFAVLLGSGGPFAHGSELFTLSMPASRQRLVGIRSAAGLIELFVIAFVPALMIPLLSPSVGQSYGIGVALVHGLCLFIASAVFLSLAVLLSTSFTDIWRPLLITCSVAIVMSFCDLVAPSLHRFNIFTVMSGESYLRTGQLPWAGLVASIVLSAAMLYAAGRNITRRDF